MKSSESLKELATAMNKAQSEMSGAKKKAKNPFFKSNYANLEEVIHCIKEPFADNGLSFMQFPVAEDGFAGVETIIMHNSGEWISNELMLKVSKNDPQGMGSAITYARRYGLQAAVGVPSEDDDGNAATRPARSPVAKTAPSRPAPVKAKPADKPATQQQRENIITLKKLKNVSEEIFTKQLVHVGCDNFLEITDAQARKLIVGYSKK